MTDHNNTLRHVKVDHTDLDIAPYKGRRASSYHSNVCHDGGQPLWSGSQMVARMAQISAGGGSFLWSIGERSTRGAAPSDRRGRSPDRET